MQILPENLFITENETNFLAFPKVADNWILFGSGYGFSSLRDIEWMKHRHILYWGDIDTHGFAVLNELRHIFPHAESILMGHATLLAHQMFWGTEPSPSRKKLSHLNPEGNALYEDLKTNRFAVNLRLEQERISFSSLVNILSSMGFQIS